MNAALLTAVVLISVNADVSKEPLTLICEPQNSKRSMLNIITFVTRRNFMGRTQHTT
jgi:hypothetical protein